MVCLSVGHVREPCKMAEPIEMPFIWVNPVGQKNHVLDRGPDPSREGAMLEVVRSIKKRWESVGLLRCTQQKKSIRASAGL